MDFYRYQNEIEKIKDTLDSIVFGLIMSTNIKLSHLFANKRLKDIARVAEGETIGNSNIYISFDNVNGVRFRLVEDEE